MLEGKVKIFNVTNTDGYLDIVKSNNCGILKAFFYTAKCASREVRIKISQSSSEIGFVYKHCNACDLRARHIFLCRISENVK